MTRVLKNPVKPLQFMLAILIITVFLLNGSQMRNLKDELNLAEKYFKEGSYRLALEVYDKLFDRITDDTTKSFVLYRMAYSSFSINEYEDAKKSLDAFEKIDKDKLEAAKGTLLKARILFQEDRYSNREMIRKHLKLIEPIFLKYPLNKVQKELIELYKLRIELFNQYSEEIECNNIKEDVLKLCKILTNDEEKASVSLWLYTDAYYCKNKLFKEFSTSLEYLQQIYDDYPKTLAASKAVLMIGSLYENQQKYLKALEYYNKVVKEFPKLKESYNSASEAIKRIKDPQVGLFVPMVYKGSDAKTLGLMTRNLELLDFKVFKIKLEDFFEKIGSVEAVDLYIIPKNAPIVKSWNLKIEEKIPHEIIDRQIQADIKENGAYIIEASGKNVTIRSLMIVSDMSLVIKRSSLNSLMWVTDALSGEPISKAALFIGSEQKYGKKDNVQISSSAKRSEYSYFSKVTKQVTDDAGIYLSKKNIKDDSESFIIAVKGDRYALSQSWGGYYYYSWRTGPYIYVQTDRPVYRPAQTVSFKAIMRDYDGKSYNYKANDDVKITIFDAQNKKIKTLETKINEFGSVNGSFVLEEKPALGQYYLYLEWGSRNTYHYFRVEEYKKPEFIVSVKPAEPQYRLGKPVEVEISADYYFGEPVKGAEVSYKIVRQYYYPSYYNYREFDWYYRNSGYDYEDDYNYRKGYGYYAPEVVKAGNGTTDENGKLKISFQTKTWKGDSRPEKYYRYIITADVTDKSRRVISGEGTLTVGDKAFLVYLNSQKHLYSPGDKVEIKAVAKTLSEEPIGTVGKMILEKANYNNVLKDYSFEKKDSSSFEITSKGEALYTLKATEDGYYRISFQTADKYDEKITGSAWFWVCSKSFRGTFYKYQGIEIVADKDEYSPGETAHLLINCEVSSNATILLTVESDILHGYKLVLLNGNSALVNVPIDAAFSPNIWLNACVVSNFKIFSTSQEIIIPPKGKFINLSVSAGKKSFKPGEKAEFSVQATDELGKPVSTEVSLGVVDSSIFYIAPDRSEDIRKFYYGQKKELGVRMSTSFDFQSRSAYVLDGLKSKLEPGVSADESSLSYARESISGVAQAPSAMPMEKKASQRKNGEQELAEAKARTDFRDTGYWNPTIVTGPDGKAKVTVDIPESLTTWKITAKGVTKDTRVGNLTDNIITKKNVIVRLQAPRFFTERDEVTLSSIVHNYLESAVKAKIYLKTTGIELFEKEAIWKDIQSGSDVRTDFKAKATEPGTAKITAFGQTTEESDAMELTFPVIVHGVEKRFGQSGKVEEKKMLDFELPFDRKKGASVLEITIAPSIAGVILDSLQYLVDYPYGCVEQTMSRFLPSVAASKALKDLGASNQKLDEKLPKVVKAGLDRLYDFQHSDGGWGWWKDDKSSLYMTSYVFYGLSLAKQAGWDVDNGRLQNAGKYIENALADYGQDLNNSAFALHSLSFNGKLGKAAKAQLEYILKNRQKLNAYSKALIAVTYANIKDNENAELMLRNLYDNARINKSTGTISWSEGISEWWYWYNDSVETTSSALRAYMKTQPKSEFIPMIIKWLVDNREGNRWKSTRDTAFAVLALTDYLKLSGEMNPEYTAKVNVGGMTLKEWKITRKDIFDYGKTIVLNDPKIPEGKFNISIEKDGVGELYYGVSLKYFTKEEDINGIGNGISISRKYYKVKDKGGTKDIRIPLKSGDTLKSGDEIEVELTVKSDNNYEYVVMEDYKPAGTEPITLVSGYAWNEGIGYQREMRDEKVVFFVNYLPQGERKLTYRIRAEVPGSFHAMPTVGYAMYAPKIYSLSDEFRLNIID